MVRLRAERDGYRSDWRRARAESAELRKTIETTRRDGDAEPPLNSWPMRNVARAGWEVERRAAEADWRSRHQEVLEALEKERACAQDLQARLDATEARLTSVLAAGQEERSRLQGETDDLTRTMEDLERDCDHLQREHEQLAREHVRLQETYRSDLENQQAEVDRLNEDRARLSDCLETSEETVKALRDDLEVLKNEHCEQEAAAVRASEEELRKTVSSLEERSVMPRKTTEVARRSLVPTSPTARGSKRTWPRSPRRSTR